jgi:hypothetical protein
MDYLIKSMRLDAEVIAWLDKLKAMHGSYNKGLRLMAFPSEGRSGPAIDVAMVDSRPVLDAVGPTIESKQGKISSPVYRAPLLRPGEKKH